MRVSRSREVDAFLYTFRVLAWVCVKVRNLTRLLDLLAFSAAKRLTEI